MNTFILHIETATKVCSVAISKNGVLIEKIESNDDQYSHGENLNLFILDVLKQSNVDKKQLSAISVCEGPGSYTGLRIGAATAKALCYGLEIPLITVGALESLYYLAKNNYSGENLIPMIDARRMEVYATVYNEDGEIIKALSADVLDEESYKEFEPFVYFGDATSKMAEVWSAKNCKGDKNIISSAVGQINPAYRKFNAKNFVDVAYWEPFYLKDFVAGKKKK